MTSPAELPCQVMTPRSNVIPFRLVPPSQGPSIELVLSSSELMAVSEHASGPVGPYVRELITRATAHGDGENALERARSRALAAGMGLGAYVRLVVLMAIGALDVGEDVALARRWVRSQ